MISTRAPNRSNISNEIWTCVGPFEVPDEGTNNVYSGQINSIAVDPRNFNVLFIGAADGGVWKTYDGGRTWIPLTDYQLVRSTISNSGTSEQRTIMEIGCVALHPQNPEIVYLGTGNPNNGFASSGNGLGVFKSSNGGFDWTPLGSNIFDTNSDNGKMASAIVYRLIVLDNSIVVAATNIGLFKYIDNNQNDRWRLVYDGIPTNNAVSDLVFDKDNTKMYAAVYGDGVYRSLDSSYEKWEKLSNSVPQIPQSVLNRISLANYSPNIIFAGYHVSRPDPGSSTLREVYILLKSTDGGNNWNEIQRPPNDAQLSFNNAIVVNPRNSNEVYIGQQRLWKSSDGGNTWSQVTVCYSSPNPRCADSDLHVDFHDLVFAPAGSYSEDSSHAYILFVANDGGISKGTINDVGIIYWRSLTKGLSIGQCGTVGVRPSAPFDFTCGLWHNGTVFSSAYLPEGSIAYKYGGGDGFSATIDAFQDETVMYFHDDAGSGGSVSRAKMRGRVTQVYVWERITDTVAFARDPYREGHFFRSDREKYFRTKFAHTASADDLRNNNSALWESIDPPNKTGDSSTLAFGIAFSSTDLPIYYIGTTKGEIWRGSPEAGWTRIHQHGTNILVQGIAVDTYTNGRIVAVFRDQTNQALTGPGMIREITRLDDGTWDFVDIDNNFNPEVKIDRLNAIAIDPSHSHTVYLGTSAGIYRGHYDGNWRWRRSPGMPNTPIVNLETHRLLGTGVSLAAISSLTSWIVPNGDEHVVGLGSDGALYDFYFIPSVNRWQHSSISQATGVTLSADSNLSSWIVPNGDEHVVGLGSDGALHEFYFIPSVNRWQHSSISQATGVTLSADSNLSSWIVPNGDEHVVGLGSDGALHEFYFIPSVNRWQHSSISQATGVTLSADSNLSSWIVPNGDEHVVGLDIEGILHDFYFIRSVNRWQHSSISQATGVTLAAISILTSWIAPNGDEHVVGLDLDGALYDFYFIPSVNRWQHTSISQATGVTLSADSNLSSWIVPNGDEHVVGLGSDGTLHEFYFIPSVNRWQHSSISQITGVTLSADSNLSSWIVPNGDEHVVGLGSDGALHEFYFIPSVNRWQHSSISQDQTTYAATYGRGVYRLEAAPSILSDPIRLNLPLDPTLMRVRAFELVEDGASKSLNVDIVLTAADKHQKNTCPI